MDKLELQRRLAARGCYDGALDGLYGPKTRSGVALALASGPDTPVSRAEIEDAAQLLGVTPAHIRAVRSVEASGDPFVDGSPTILFEPHRFSRATGGRFDLHYPMVSYPKWSRAKYPRTQAARYGQLLTAVGLDVDAGFASASYGSFQILGENYRQCGCADSYSFAMTMSESEGMQLLAFCRFLDATGLDEPLRRGDWRAFARGYNGTAFEKNGYHTRLAVAFARERRAS